MIAQPEWLDLEPLVDTTLKQLYDEANLQGKQRHAVKKSLSNLREVLRRFWNNWDIGAAVRHNRAQNLGLRVAEVFCLELALRTTPGALSAWIDKLCRSVEDGEIAHDPHGPIALLKMGSIGAMLSPFARELPQTFVIQQPVIRLREALKERNLPRTADVTQHPGPHITSRSQLFPSLYKLSTNREMACGIWFIAVWITFVAVGGGPTSLILAIGAAPVLPSVLARLRLLVRRLAGRKGSVFKRSKLRPAQRGVLLLSGLGSLVAVATPLILLATGSSWPMLLPLVLLLLLGPLLGLALTQTTPSVLYLATSGPDAIERRHRVSRALDPLRVISLVCESKEEYRATYGIWTRFVPEYLVFANSKYLRMDGLDNLRDPELDDEAWIRYVADLMRQVDVVLLDTQGISHHTAEEAKRLSAIIRRTSEPGVLDRTHVILLADCDCMPLLAWGKSFPGLREEVDVLERRCPSVNTFEEIPSAVRDRIDRVGGRVGDNSRDGRE